jgi:hypothetical protein
MAKPKTFEDYLAEARKANRRSDKASLEYALMQLGAYVLAHMDSGAKTLTAIVA